ncbi:hypothetical protein [Streptomyces sp. NPDC048710]|uniref:hypothetical protein n=1 Tax=unclassified Streptomyces TaxID=2593676 RepID=UPI0037200296
MADADPEGHVPPDDLASIALDEAHAAGDADLARALAHVTRCRACRAALGELRRVVAAGRAASPDDDVMVPPPGLWQAVAGALHERRSRARRSGCIRPGPGTGSG